MISYHHKEKERSKNLVKTKKNFNQISKPPPYPNTISIILNVEANTHWESMLHTKKIGGINMNAKRRDAEIEGTVTLTIEDHTGDHITKVSLPDRFVGIIAHLAEADSKQDETCHDCKRDCEIDCESDGENSLGVFRTLNDLILDFTPCQARRFNALCQSHESSLHTLGDLLALALEAGEYESLPGINSPFLVTDTWKKFCEKSNPDVIPEIPLCDYSSFGQFLLDRFGGIIFRGNLYYTRGKWFDR